MIDPRLIPLFTAVVEQKHVVARLRNEMVQKMTGPEILTLALQFNAARQTLQKYVADLDRTVDVEIQNRLKDEEIHK